MRSLYISLFLAATMLAACTRSLELDPVSTITNESFWKTEDDVKAALNGIYVKLRNDANSNLFTWGEARSEIWTGALAGTQGYDLFYLNALTTSTPGPSWIDMYATINAANLILKYAPGITFSSEAARNNALAQTYTMRAYVYFTLMKTFGDLPLRLEPMEGYDPATVQVSKTPKDAVMRFIKSDLAKALSLYPDNKFANGRNTWSKPAANAFKADLYLWTAKRMNGGTTDLDTALTAVNEVQQTDVQLLPNYADIFSYTNKGNKEVIMAVRFQLLESSDNYFNLMYFHNSNFPSNITQATRDTIGTPGGNNSLQVAPAVRSQFSEDDLRRSATFYEIYLTTDAYYGSIIMKGRGTVDGGVRHFKNDVILYRYADVLLMKAEIRNALGQDPSEEMNMVRQRAYGPNADQHIFTNGTKEQNDEAILRERLLELTGECKRWWDLVRFNKAFDLVPSLKDRKGQDYLLVFPIGNAIRSLEPKVDENPGY